MNQETLHVMVILALMKRLGVKELEITREEADAALDEALASGKPCLGVSCDKGNLQVAFEGE